ncbi:MAG: hypothetical protein GX422_00525 [Deltaproteobacteria bacterium]|jgi:hypothetical protein|nr:hypothetical protein [Deltaproteobacteria bacterium]
MRHIMVIAVGLAVIIAFCNGCACAAAPRNGLVAEYLFEGNARDTSGNGNHGNVQGAVLTKDRFGRSKAAYSFNGSSSYIEISKSKSLNLTQSLTFAAWVNITSLTSGGVAVLLCKGTTYVSYNMYIYQNKLYVGFNNVPIYNGNMDILQNKWIHLAVTWNGTNIKSYINGIMDPNIREFKGTLDVTDENFFLGMDPPGAYEYLHGKLDDVRIYNRALNVEEIYAVYHDKDPVIGSLTATPDAGSAPLALEFTCRATSPNGTISQYLWDVNGDGITDFVTGVGTLLHTYTANRTYKARVTVVDSAGYKALSDYLRVRIGDGPELAGKVEYYEFDDTAKTVKMKVRLYNWGNTAAVPFNVVFSLSDNGIGSKTFRNVRVADGLGAGKNMLVTVRHTFAESVYDRMISIALDGGRKVAEVDETNNGLNLFVGPASK